MRPVRFYVGYCRNKSNWPKYLLISYLLKTGFFIDRLGLSIGLTAEKKLLLYSLEQVASRLLAGCEMFD